MRAIGIGLAFALAATTAMAQDSPAQAMKTFTSSAEITALIAKAKAERKNNAPIVNETILALAPIAANLEYRASIGPSAVHEFSCRRRDTTAHENAGSAYAVEGAAVRGC